MRIPQEFHWPVNLHGMDLVSALRLEIQDIANEFEIELAEARVEVAILRLLSNQSRHRVEIKDIRRGADFGLKELRINTTIGFDLRALRIYFVKHPRQSDRFIGLGIQLKAKEDPDASRQQQNLQIQKAIDLLVRYLFGGLENQ